MRIEINRALDIPNTVMNQLAHDLLSTAVEGGINYWAAVSGYTWGNPDLGHSDGRPWSQGDTPYIKVTVHTETGDTHDLDEGAMVAAMVLVLTRGGGEFDNDGYTDTFPVRLARVLEEVAAGKAVEDTDYDFDAADADCMVQIACFGEVIYG